MRVVELFAGAGGASLGILAAGFTEVRAVEWNHEACETRRAAGLRCDEGDVRDPVHYEGVSADVVWSSFPCQAWSTAGKRLGKDDPRNGWPWTVDVLDQVRPRWFIGENVAGLTHHRGACNGRCVDECARLYLEETIRRQLSERFAWVDWRILDAAQYGVPQNRERLILVAGPRPIEWPRETHAPPSELRTVGLFGETRKPWRTVREALGLVGTVWQGGIGGCGLPQNSSTSPAPSIVAKGTATILEDPVAIVRESGVGAERDPRSIDEPAYTMRVQHNGGGCGVSLVKGDGRGAIPQSRRPMRLDTPADTIQASGEGPRPPCIPAGDYQLSDQYGDGNAHSPWYNANRPSRVVSHDPQRITRAASRPELLDRPSPTGTAVGECKGSGDGGNPQKMQRASDALFLGAGIRRLTPAECAILQDFPADHPWQGTKTSIYAQIGNAVPPTLARVVCEAVAKADALARSAA